MELQVLVLSKPGKRPSNEDACGFWSSDSACFCVVADGAGGHRGGGVASKLAVKQALEWFRETPVCTPATVADALRAANDGILQEQREDPGVSDMRATAVVLAIDTSRDQAVWGHLGDSRLYCFRQNRIVVQTRDHSVVQSMVDAGYLKFKELRSIPARSKLLGALGDAEHFKPRVEETMFMLEDGDVFLLCTDGLWEYVEEEDMERLLDECASPEDWLRALEEKVLAQADERQDNYSAIVVACRQPRGLPPAQPA